MEKFQFHRTVEPGDPQRICEFLALHTRLSKQKIKAAMQKGAVTLSPPNGKRRRVRRATAELFFTPRRQVFPVHRLDRKASGIIVIAHTKLAAAGLSRLFQKRAVGKHFVIEVADSLETKSGTGKITSPLDGKSALTKYQVLQYIPERNTSIVLVRIETGRMHQIRRHFASIGCPVMGDAAYGKENKENGGLRLSAFAVSIQMPVFRKGCAGKTEPARCPLVATARQFQWNKRLSLTGLPWY